MRLSEFTTRIIEDAIVSAHDGHKNEMARCGAIAGLEACRGLEPHQLGELLKAANTAAVHARRQRHPRTIEAVAFRAEILWVCEVLSVVMDNQGMPPLVDPTPQAYLKAAEVTGSERHIIQ